MTKSTTFLGFFLSVLSACDNGRYSSLSPANIDLPDGKKGKVQKATKLTDEYTIVQLARKGNDSKFVLLRNNKQVMVLDSFGNGFQLDIPINGRLAATATLVESDEGDMLSIVRYLAGKEGKRIMVEYDNKGDVQRKSPTDD